MPPPITYAEAQMRIADLTVIRQRERVPLPAAAGRVLAEDVHLARPQPPFDRATMDGYAVVPDGDRRTFDVVGSLTAGASGTFALRPGQAVRIMTGARTPAGATVVPVELTDQAGQPAVGAGLSHRTSIISVEVTVTDGAALAPGRNIAWTGEDGPAGAMVLRTGTRLAPITLALAASAGVADLSVVVPPRLTVITTGDEVGAGSEAGVNDSNGPFLAALLAFLGLPVAVRHAPDDAIALRATLAMAIEGSEVVVTTGGVSAGDRDLIPVLLPSLGLGQVFHGVDMQPGKPVLIGRRGDGKLLVGLPGNPVSTLVTAHLVLLPVLQRLLGAPPSPWQPLPLAVPWHHRGRRRLFLPARRTPEGVQPLAWNGSGDLIAAAAGDGLIDLQPGADLAAGAAVPYLPYVGAEPGHLGLLPDRRLRT